MNRAFHAYSFANVKMAHRRRDLLIVLFLAFLLIGCSDPAEDFRDVQFVPVGEWIGPADWGKPDKYIITDTKITYVDPWGSNNFAGTIITAVDFTNNAGVIIIQILDDPFPDAYTIGKFTCVYYREYSSSYIKLAPPCVQVGDYDWNYIEVNTITEAKEVFTVDNVDNHVAWKYSSGYTK